MTAIKDKEIETYVNGLSDFQKEIVMAVREAVLNADERMKEAIKWGSIAFYHNKNICGFRVAKAHVTLLFMEGASLKTPNMLSGTGAKARTVKYTKLEDVDATALKKLVQESLGLGM